MSLRSMLTILGLFVTQMAHAQTNLLPQMVVPGFSVRELPVVWPSLVGLAFSPEGKLFVLSQDGRVFTVRDTNRDGLEDSPEIFSDKPVLVQPTSLAWVTNGLCVTTRGRIVLLTENPATGRSDHQTVLASNWPLSTVVNGSPDAAGLAVDKEGNIYFGLTSGDETNPTLPKDGKSRYDIKQPRGTIQKWSPKTRTHENLATGFGHPTSLGVNRLGDLFATDRTGSVDAAEPIDEIDFIQPGRHYGVPASRASFLPGIVNMPPVLGFPPSPQGLTGLVFSDRFQNRPFGPASWEADAFVAGAARGKIWRVRLVKTTDGYVGQPQLIASAPLHLRDLALSPRGDLYALGDLPLSSTSSNQSRGRIFKISYTDTNAPQPGLVWAQSPSEVRVAFDRPIPPGFMSNLIGETIRFGQFVSTADRLETLRVPGGQARDQAEAAVGHLPITRVRVLDDRRTLALTTGPHPQTVNYTVNLGGASQPEDVGYNLHGVQGEWFMKDHTKSSWVGWFPHLELLVNQALTVGSAQHQRLFSLATTRGRLHLRTQLQLPPGQLSVHISRNAPFEVNCKGQHFKALFAGKRLFSVDVPMPSQGEWVPLEVIIETGAVNRPHFRVSYTTDQDPAPRPLPLSAFYLPWAPPRVPPAPSLPEDRNLVAGGNWERGRKLFFGDRAKCASCHRVRGEGAELAPDLSGLVGHKAVHVLRDITEPSLAIHPDFNLFEVSLRDDTEVVGMIKTISDTEYLCLTREGTTRSIPRQSVKSLKPLPSSFMPADLLTSLSSQEKRDLLTFLVTKEPAWDSKESFPVRPRAEIDNILARGARFGGPSLPHLRITLVATKQDHGPGEHDYPAWQAKWADLLSSLDQVTVRKATDWPSSEMFDQSDVIVFYFWNHLWNPERLARLEKYLARGGGLVFLHSACIADTDPETLARPIGLSAQPVRTKYRHGPLDFVLTEPQTHPITRDLPKTIHFLDEPYWPLIGQTEKVTVLGTSMEEEKAHPMCWIYQNQNGRIFGTVLGHFTWTLDDPLYRIMVLRAISWAGKQHPDRLLRVATEDVNPFAP